MKIFVFKNTMSIREPGVLVGGELVIDFTGLNDGERVTLRASNGKYLVGEINSGRVVFDGASLVEGETYSVTVAGVYPVAFTYANGAFYHVYDGVSEELTRMWAVLVDLAQDIRAVDAKISKFTDGWQTE